MMFLYGVIGFLGFEGLRIYKCLLGNRPIIPANKAWWYAGTVMVLAIFSGIVAHALDPRRGFEAIYLGFSVPCGLKAFLENKLSQSDLTDDIVVEKFEFWRYLRNVYLGFG